MVIARVLLAVPLCLSLLPAQQRADPAALEHDFKVRTSQAIASLADGFAAQKQYARALQLRLELLKEYDEDHAAAREACGYVRTGDVWRRDMDKLVLDKDQRGDAGKIKKLEQDWERLQRDLGRDHDKVAAALAAAGDQLGAERHLRRALRFRPGDKALLARLPQQQFDGFSGNEREVALLRRSRALRAAVEFLRQMPVAVEPLGAQRDGVLQRAGVGHSGVRSAHFTVWGTVPPPDLVRVAQHAELALLLCRTMFGTAGGRIWQPALLRDQAYVTDRAIYQRILDANKDAFPDAERFKFIRDELNLCFVDDGERQLRVNLSDKPEVMLDADVRGVAQDATSLHDGLWEGVGHATCGLLLDQTLSFLVDLTKARTVTNVKPRPLLPDIATWMQIAAESAWCKTDTPASRLVLVDAGRFSNEERVKSWAMVDYLVRTHPAFLFELNNSLTKGTHSPPEIEAEFKRRTGVDLAAVDADWREYWARMQPVRDAAAAGPRGKKEVVDGARQLANAINLARAAADVGPLGFVVAEAQPVLKYLADLAAAEAEAKKDPSKPPAQPSPPNGLDRTLFVGAGVDAAATVAKWLCNPAMRDLLLHPGRQLIGCCRTPQAFVLDLGEAAMPTTDGWPMLWPRDGQVDVPGAATVADLGKPAIAALAKEGKQPGDVVGMPLTAHFCRALDDRLLASVSVRVTCDGSELDGVLVRLQGDGDRAVAADGCLCFVPLRKLASGMVLRAEWQMPPKLLPKGQASVIAKFTVK